MKFYGKYYIGNVPSAEEEIVMDVPTEHDAYDVLRQMAADERESYEGNNDVRSWRQVALDNDLNPDTEDPYMMSVIESYYAQEVDEDISVSVEPFDEDDETHMAALNAQEGEFWRC